MKLSVNDEATVENKLIAILGERCAISGRIEQI